MFCHQKVIFSPCNVAYKFWFIFHGFCANARQKARNKNTNMQRRTRLVQKMSPKINYNELQLHLTEVTAMENLLFRHAQSSKFVIENTNLKNDLEFPKDFKLKKLLPKWDNESEPWNCKIINLWSIQKKIIQPLICTKYG